MSAEQSRARLSSMVMGTLAHARMFGSLPSVERRVGAESWFRTELQSHNGRAGT